MNIYKTHNVCSRSIEFEVENNIITACKFNGGCAGNTQGVAALVVGMTVPDISGKAIANLGYEEVKHLGPVFVNDTLYARTTILGKRESKSKPDRGVVYVETVGYNQHGEAVISFRRHVLVKKQA